MAGQPTYPLVQHPTRFVWDFWYYHDADEKLFHVLFLNADRSLAATDAHHWQAQVGYATTRDFVSVDWHATDVFTADPDGWDNTSIWTGDLIRGREGFILLYTSRSRDVGDGMTQNIGMAVSKDLRHWERVPDFRLAPDPQYYEAHTHPEDDSIHAWRDPYLFRHNGQLFMLVAAKGRDLLPGRKGVVGLLRSVDGSLLNWEALPPLYASGYVSECDVPILYTLDGTSKLVYTVHARYDHAPMTGGAGGLHGISTPALFVKPWMGPAVLLAKASGMYAARVIPELGGDIVGPDFRLGGWQRVPAQTGFRHVDRDFRDLWPGG
ncbi:MAG: beta-fructosidase [Chloroflexota bacterium]